MTTVYGYNTEWYDHIISLYKTHEIRLKKIREDMNSVKYRYDDIEAEITCLIIMDTKPSVLKEFSPCGGWSTNYIIRACEDTCKIESFDSNSTCMTNVHVPNWTFTQGDVKEHFARMVSDKPKYLFIKSDHSREFTKIYVEELLEKLVGTGIIVSVHDVFHSQEPSEEGVIILNFLKKYNIAYFTPTNKTHLHNLVDVKMSMGIGDLAHLSWNNPTPYKQANPSIFFKL
jgi:hypothetical protein